MSRATTAPSSAPRLHQNGILNLQCLGKLVTEQQLDYDFQFHQMSFAVDNPTLAVSLGGRSLVPGFPLALRVPVREGSPMAESDGESADDDQDPEDTFRNPSPALLNVWRRYLRVAQLQEFTVDDQLSQTATAWFVAQRCEGRTGQPRPTEESLHLVLNLARYAVAVVVFFLVSS